MTKAYRVLGNLSKKQEDILKSAYEELRYAFGKTGYPNAGSFIHVCNHGVFYLTDTELEKMS